MINVIFVLDNIIFPRIKLNWLEHRCYSRDIPLGSANVDDSFKSKKKWNLLIPQILNYKNKAPSKTTLLNVFEGRI